MRAAATMPEATQADLLSAFVRRNVGTAFGKEHGFERLRTVDDYRRAVPIRDHAGFAPWLDRVTRGEAGVLTAEPSAMFFRTAGTTGAPKALPVTKTAMGTTRGPAMYALWGNFLEFHPEMLENEHATIDLHWDRRPVAETVGSQAIAVQSMAQRHGLLHADDFSPPWYEAPWFRPQTDTTDYVERLYSKIRFFASKDVRAVVSINPITLLPLRGDIWRGIPISLIERGCAQPPVWPARSPTRAWPGDFARPAGMRVADDSCRSISGRASRFKAAGRSATAALYLPKLYKLFGEQVEVLPYSTAGAEGSQAIPVDRHDTAGMAALGSAFMEFLPATAAWRTDSPTSLVHELELGAEYQTVLTTPDGLYRCAIGDTFKVVEFFGRVPLLEYRGRTGRFASMVGERLSERQVVDAGQVVASRFGLDFAMFTCCPRSTPHPHYVFVMETSARVVERGAIAAALDKDSAWEIEITLRRVLREPSRRSRSNSLIRALSTTTGCVPCAVAMGQYNCKFSLSRRTTQSLVYSQSDHASPLVVPC